MTDAAQSALQAEIAHWKANHDSVVRTKREKDRIIRELRAEVAEKDIEGYRVAAVKRVVDQLKNRIPDQRLEQIVAEGCSCDQLPAGVGCGPCWAREILDERSAAK